MASMAMAAENIVVSETMSEESKEALYAKAVETYEHTNEKDKLINAQNTFKALGNYKDSESYVGKCQDFIDYSKGETVTLGTYKGKDLRWKVLDQGGNNRMLLAEDVIECQVFNEVRDHTYWTGSSLRRWLNREFMEEAFSLKERMSIIITLRKADSNPRWSCESGSDSKDKIFIFSHTELDEYLPSPADRALGDDKWWWLRTSGSNALSMEVVEPDGEVYDIGINKNDPQIAVRPVFWIKLRR